MTSRAGLRLRATGQIVAAAPGGGFASVVRGRRGAAAGDAVAVVGAEAARRLLRQRVAVTLAVGGADERGDDVEVPLADLRRLAPEIGQPEVDVELQQVDPGRSLRHVRKRRRAVGRHPYRPGP